MCYGEIDGWWMSAIWLALATTLLTTPSVPALVPHPACGACFSLIPLTSTTINHYYTLPTTTFLVLYSLSAAAEALNMVIAPCRRSALCFDLPLKVSTTPARTHIFGRANFVVVRLCSYISSQLCATAWIVDTLQIIRDTEPWTFWN